MTENRWPPTSYDPLLAEVGRIIFNFNTLERSIKTILWCLASRDQNDQVHHAVAMHLGNIAVSDALRTVANEFYQGGIKSGALNVLEVFDRTREYRNWYVHGFGNIMSDGTGLLYGAAAKHRLVDYEQSFTVPDAAWLADWCHTASRYSAEVYCFCAEKLGRLAPGDQPRSLPERLILPERLLKPRRLRLNDQAPPEPSPL